MNKEIALINEAVGLTEEIESNIDLMHLIAQEKLFESQVLILSHILCLSGRNGQLAASKSILESNNQKKSRLFISACATKHSDYNDCMKRLLIKNSGINHFFAESVKVQNNQA